ncbi:hypothetical protein RDI58_031008 [Solanum bulbocastanum]|uniref:Uncharacterized protein n=1 Tax=Solanum bulbocastanum TaxID=147425 RepID=A0AAN8STD4_SOLBU
MNRILSNISISPLNYSYISYEFHFAPETILGEVRIRSVRILIGLGLTWFTRYWFPEELISPLAKPFLTLPLDSYFVRTQSTEAFPTYVATSPIACSYFVFPLISHQIWCFLIPSCYGEQRTKYNRFLHLSGSRFSLFLFLTPPRVVPNVWHFPYFMGATSTNSLMIKLQPKIYDHIMLTVRISFIPSVCSQMRELHWSLCGMPSKPVSQWRDRGASGPKSKEVSTPQSPRESRSKPAKASRQFDKGRKSLRPEHRRKAGLSMLELIDLSELRVFLVANDLRELAVQRYSKVLPGYGFGVYVNALSSKGAADLRPLSDETVQTKATRSASRNWTMGFLPAAQAGSDRALARTAVIESGTERLHFNSINDVYFVSAKAKYITERKGDRGA